MAVGFDFSYFNSLRGKLALGQIFVILLTTILIFFGDNKVNHFKLISSFGWIYVVASMVIRLGQLQSLNKNFKIVWPYLQLIFDLSFCLFYGIASTTSATLIGEIKMTMKTVPIIGAMIWGFVATFTFGVDAYFVVKSISEESGSRSANSSSVEDGDFACDYPDLPEMDDDTTYENVNL